MIFELLVNSMMNLMKKPRRSVEAAPLTFGSRADPIAASGITLSLLDVEAGSGLEVPPPQHDKRRNGYLSVPSSRSSGTESRSRSTSPLFLNRTFTFPSPKTGPTPVMRFVSKTGECNVRHSNVKRKGYKYLADIFTTLVDCKWRWCALIFAFGFFSTWLLYAFVYFFFAWLHDDLTKGNLTEEEWTPCINKIKDFTSAFLYSLETQHTIGYGYRFANTECPHVIIVLCFQCLTGVALQSILVGVLFAKLSRPKMRSETLMFSKEGTINVFNFTHRLNTRLLQSIKFYSSTVEKFQSHLVSQFRGEEVLKQEAKNYL
ncbi:hypothetical protein RvY_10889-2 [Ramazzottius varieornatus]|uniref:Potassium channel inwardly rectifying transmembrane domain-containing protein n=1 Tax=Ramazzottius varieornatus TaxID=947166 RepID=A0A1D1VGB1_RAMVA|nr:hypothetical protein RvY_10889-2 [Ramazzottius varieornatus]